jgi:hypothetical protein
MLERPNPGRAARRLIPLLGMLLLHLPVQAQVGEPSYEDQRVQLVLAAAKLTIDPAPEGKSVTYVRLVRRQVLEPDDLRLPLVLPRFASTWPNAFHWLTEASTVRREVLLQPNAAYSQALAEESMRNLRNLGLFALVKIVAVKTADPQRVGVLVFTRDLWSLRLEQSFAGVGGTYALGAQLIERNLFGRGKALAASASLDLFRFSVGESYLDPRVMGEQLRLAESLGVIFNRATQSAEGSLGSLEFGHPFYTLAQTSAFDLLAYYSDQIARVTSGDQVLGFATDPGRLGAYCSVGASDSAANSCLPRVWHDQVVQLEATYDYRIGQAYKQTFTLGAEFLDKHQNPTAEAALSATQAQLLRDLVLPKGRRDAYPFVRYRLSLPNYSVFTNLTTFGQSENVQTGPSVDGLIGVPLRAYGASSDGMLVRGTLSYVWARDDALFDVLAQGLSRLESGAVVDQVGVVRLRAASPSWPALLGRLVARASWDVRHNDTQRTFVALGGDNGLRGYAAQRFWTVGGRRILGNLEYRSQPWQIQSVHLGAVAFYDVGSVYRALAGAEFHQAVGLGLRVLFPQFNHSVFRVDFGVPLERAGGVGMLLSYSSEQFVPLTAAEDAAASNRLGTGP